MNILNALPANFIIMSVVTFVLWVTVAFFHWNRRKITIIPLYAFITGLSMFMNLLGLLNINVVFNNLYFLVSSTMYFTPVLLAIIILYLSDGIQATRKALEVIIGISALTLFTIIVSASLDTKNVFIPLSTTMYKIYFWSVLALTIDIITVALGWELLNKIKKLPLVISLTTLIFMVGAIDTFIFVTGFFYGNPEYINIIKSDLIVRAILAVTMGGFLSWYFKFSGFSEDKRIKPTKIWEFLDLKSEDTAQIELLNRKISTEANLAKEVLKSQEIYKDVLDSVDAGIWEWDVPTKTIVWSDKSYSLLGYKKKELPDFNFDKFISMVHPEDVSRIQEALIKNEKEGVPYKIEYRVLTKSGEYKWFSANGVSHFDKNNKRVRMVGSLIDVSDKKAFEDALKEKVDTLTSMNKLLVDRELKMVELKEQLKSKA